MRKLGDYLPIPKIAIIGSICMIVSTGLVTGKASDSSQFATTSALEAEVAGVEASSSDLEKSFIDSLGANDAEIDEALEALKEKSDFTFTDQGGLKATNPFCARFIDEDGKYGIYGKIIANYLAGKSKENRTTEMLAEDLVGTEDAPAICPNWRSFDESQRIKFWVWTFGAISSIECSCGASRMGMKGVRGTVASYKKDKRGNFLRNKKGDKIPAHYLTAIGLLQLEKENSFRLSRHLPACNVSESAIANTVNNLRCGIDIMESLVSPYPPAKNPWPIYPGKGMPPTSYWQELRAVNGGSIGKLIREYEPCYEKRENPGLFNFDL